MNDPSPDRKILVVDDDPNICAYIAQILAHNNWQADTTCDGPGALELIERQPYAAVVLDYRMPGMDGAELCREIERRRPGIPKVLLTGYPTIDTVFPAVEAGVNRVIAKPLDPQELIDVLQDQLSPGVQT